MSFKNNISFSEYRMCVPGVALRHGQFLTPMNRQIPLKVRLREKSKGADNIASAAKITNYIM